MSHLVNLGLLTKNEKVLVSSRIISEKFDKEHAEVVYAIEGRTDTKGNSKNKGLINEISGISHVSRYFIKTEYQDSMNRTQTEYLLTRDGFSLLVMGFTGQKALKWKVQYIEAFNTMEAFIAEKNSAEWKEARQTGKNIRKEETDIILTKLIPLAEAQGSQHAGKLYITYSKLVNSMLNIEAGQRSNLPLSYIDAIKFLENAIENIISIEVDKGTHYKEIYHICKVKCQIIKDLAFLPSIKMIGA